MLSWTVTKVAFKFLSMYIYFNISFFYVLSFNYVVLNWYRFRDGVGNANFDYFCTGMCTTEEDKQTDEEIS